MDEQRDTIKQDLEIRFADGFEPPLPGGNYTIEAKQTLTLKKEGSPQPFADKKTVYVSAPRFILGPGEIYSVYPPAGQSGAFHTTLPHIVFARKTLPWEREIVGPRDDTKIRPPWMALLTLDDDEIEQQQVRVQSVPLSQLFKPPAGVRGPEIKPEPGERAQPTAEEQDQCLVLDMPTSLFHGIAPALDELRYLAHARQVGTEDKDLADAVADGWFAVIIGNRLPRQGRQNLGLLVSLEGQGNILKKERSGDRPSGLPGTVRLAVLKHWTYVSEGPTFEELLEGLSRDNEDRKETDVWLRVTPPPGATADKAVLDALDLGYTALTHSTRQGGQTVSWYRGPLVPRRLYTGAYHAIHANADEALRYDATTGLFDVSYSAAWQLGRLLALQKSDFANSLLHRKSGYVAEEVLKEADGMLKAEHNNGGVDGQKAKLLLQDDLMVAILTEWWLSNAAKGG
jgi:hypothetical protein